MRLAVGLIILGSCAARSRAHPAEDDASKGQRGDCIEEPDAEREEQREAPGDPCEVDVSHVDISGYTDEQRITLAKQRFEQGKMALERSDPRVALRAFEEGYAYAPERHVFSLDIARVALHLECCEHARDAYRRFLDLVPAHPARDQAGEELRMIEAMGCAYG